jgi:hypothetical protein
MIMKKQDKNIQAYEQGGIGNAPPKRVPPRLEGKVRNVGIRPVKKTKKED